MDIFFNKVAGLECLPAIILRTDSTTEVLLHESCKTALSKTSENFLPFLYSKSYRPPIYWLQLYRNWCVWKKWVKLTFNFILGKNQYFYLNADADAEILTINQFFFVILVHFFRPPVVVGKVLSIRVCPSFHPSLIPSFRPFYRDLAWC